jgi:hypothetical protein
MIIETELFIGGDVFIVAEHVVAVEEHFGSDEKRTGSAVVHCVGGRAFHVDQAVEDFVTDLRRALIA